MCRTERPAAMVTWRKGLTELPASGKHTPSQDGLTLKLTISALTKADSDTYTCDIGQACSQARLLVQGEAWQGLGLCATGWELGLEGLRGPPRPASVFLFLGVGPWWSRL